MALGILEPKSDASPPGTELLVDTEQSNAGHANLKHGKGKVRHNYIQQWACTDAKIRKIASFWFLSHPTTQMTRW
jgi:hypothetical protein